jgi:hypothetical protein
LEVFFKFLSKGIRVLILSLLYNLWRLGRRLDLLLRVVKHVSVGSGTVFSGLELLVVLRAVSSFVCLGGSSLRFLLFASLVLLTVIYTLGSLLDVNLQLLLALLVNNIYSLAFNSTFQSVSLLMVHIWRWVLKVY